MGFKKGSKSLATSTSPCSDLRSAYQNCFNRWYSEKFVKGQWDKEECVSEWNKYRACLSEHLEDRNLRRFLEEEMPVNSSIKADGTSLDETPIELIENYLRMCQSGAICSPSDFTVSESICCAIASKHFCFRIFYYLPLLIVTWKCDPFDRIS